MDHPAALHRLRVGVPATVEHSSEAGPETGKWVAETTQVRYSLLTWFNDSSEPCYRALLRLWMRWSFECVPRISYIRFYGNLLLAMHGSREAKTGKAGARWLGGVFPLIYFSSCRAIIWPLEHRLITLNGMKASEEITEEQTRQVRKKYPVRSGWLMNPPMIVIVRYWACLYWVLQEFE